MKTVLKKISPSPVNVYVFFSFLSLESVYNVDVRKDQKDGLHLVASRDFWALGSPV